MIAMMMVLSHCPTLPWHTHHLASCHKCLHVARRRFARRYHEHAKKCVYLIIRRMRGANRPKACECAHGPQLFEIIETTERFLCHELRHAVMNHHCTTPLTRARTLQFEFHAEKRPWRLNAERTTHISSRIASSRS